MGAQKLNFRPCFGVRFVRRFQAGGLTGTRFSGLNSDHLSRCQIGFVSFGSRPSLRSPSRGSLTHSHESSSVLQDAPSQAQLPEKKPRVGVSCVLPFH